jgi:hypothetical protein
MNPAAVLVRRAVIAPVVLAIAALWIAFEVSAWAALALPFVVLGSLCAAPFLVLMDALPVLLAVALSAFVAHYHQEAGASIFLGTIVSWVLSSIEKRVRAVTVHESPRAQ